MNDSLKAALWTALFTFIGTVAIAFLPFLQAIGDWLNGDDPDLADDWSNFSRVLIAAFIAAVSAIVNWVVRWVQSRGVLPGSGPSYASKAAAAHGEPAE